MSVVFPTGKSSPIPFLRAQPMVGKEVLHYKIVAELGAGGMGVVWEALDTSLERRVALKFLPAAVTMDPASRERFLREAKAASALNHPNIVTIYEINSLDGQLFIAMELIRGRSLSALLRERKWLPPDLALDYAIQLCAGLGEAHRAGIVHRDIKPSNLMLTQDGVLKILDFGLAKASVAKSRAAVPGGSLAEPLTVAGAVLGTVPYMSPEQASGGEVGPGSDVFSIGIVLYEMLSGQRPFRGSSDAEVRRSVISGEPPFLGTLVADLPEALAQITHKCLKKRREARFRDAVEVGTHLHDLHPGSWPRPRFDQSTAAQTGFPRKFRGPLAGAAALVLAGAGVAAVAWWPRGKSAVSPRPAAEALAPADALRRAEEYLRRYDRKGNVDRAIATLEASSRRNASNAALGASFAEAYVRKYNETPDKQWLEKALKSARQAVAANDDLASGHVALAMALAASGQSDEAARQFERARDLNPLSGPAHLGLARLRSGPEAELLFQKAVQYSPGEWVPLHEQALFYYRNADYERSIAGWRQALQAAPDSVLVMGYLAAGLHMKGQYPEVADTLQRALALDATNAATWANLGTARYFQGHFLEAARATEKAVDLAPGRYFYWGNLGDSYRRVEELQSKAGGAYQKAIGLVRERLAVTPNDTALHANLAMYLAKSGDSAGALAELAQVEHDPVRDKSTLFKSALVYESVQNRDKALAVLDRAIRAGYSMHEIANEADLAALRSDPGYAKIAHREAAKK